MDKKELKIENKREAQIFMLGQLKGLNDCRIRFWGIGYDKDDTAREIRKFTNENIFDITEKLKLGSILECMFSDVDTFVKEEIIN